MNRAEKEGDKAPQPLDRADVSVAMAGCLDIGIMYSEVGCGWGSEVRRRRAEVIFNSIDESSAGWDE